MIRWRGRVVAGAAAGVMAVAAGQAAAQTPPEGLVWMALNAINADYFDRDDPTNRPPLATEVPPGMLRPVDVSRDGRTDWIMDFGAAGLSTFCGTGGCARILYVSGGETGFIRAFDGQALAFDVVERDGEARVEAQVHHLHCRPGQTDCLYAWAWDPELGQLVERPAADGLTRLEGGGLDPVDPLHANRPDDLPEDLSRAWFGGRLTCRDTRDDGFTTLRPGFRSIPDINGDDRRDWIGTPPVCVDDDTGSPVFELWVTGEGGGLEIAYTSEPDHYPSIDIGTTPATVMTSPACGHGEPCPDIRLRWDGVRRRFVPTGS